MARPVSRLIALLAFLTSAWLVVTSVVAISGNPLLQPMRDASEAEIATSVERLLAWAATAEQVSLRLKDRLAETPRNWVAIESLVDLAASRGLRLSDDLMAGVRAARAEDFSALRQVADCAACVVDFGACSLTHALVCKAPVLLTPVEDLRGIVQAGADFATGQPIDQIDLGLSIVGLSATGLAVASGGNSLTVKAGTATIKLARGLRLLSLRLTDEVLTSLRRGIDWKALPSVRSSTDLKALVQPESLSPLWSLLSDLGRTSDLLGPAATLHLLPLVGDAADAARLGRLGNALGRQTVGAAEVLGKSRLFRATLRFSDLAVDLMIGLTGALTSLGVMVAGMLQSLMLRGLHRNIV